MDQPADHVLTSSSLSRTIDPISEVLLLKMCSKMRAQSGRSAGILQLWSCLMSFMCVRCLQNTQEQDVLVVPEVSHTLLVNHLCLCPSGEFVFCPCVVDILLYQTLGLLMDRFRLLFCRHT